VYQCYTVVAELAPLAWNSGHVRLAGVQKRSLDSGNRAGPADHSKSFRASGRRRRWESNSACPAMFHEIRSELFNDQ
jgi:hypothetical protein